VEKVGQGSILFWKCKVYFGFEILIWRAFELKTVNA
jgi:hypothetical protein